MGARASGKNLSATEKRLSAIGGDAQAAESADETDCVPRADAACHGCVPPAPGRRRRGATAKEALDRARRWQAMIDSGEVKNAAQIASKEGRSRARVSQVMSFLRLAPEIIEFIDAPGDDGDPGLGERRLRRFAALRDHDEQRARFSELVGVTIAKTAPTSPRVAPADAEAVVGSAPEEREAEA